LEKASRSLGPGPPASASTRCRMSTSESESERARATSTRSASFPPGQLLHPRRRSHPRQRLPLLLPRPHHLRRLRPRLPREATRRPKRLRPNHRPDRRRRRLRPQWTPRPNRTTVKRRRAAIQGRPPEPEVVSPSSRSASRVHQLRQHDRLTGRPLPLPRLSGCRMASSPSRVRRPDDRDRLRRLACRPPNLAVWIPEAPRCRSSSRRRRARKPPSFGRRFVCRVRRERCWEGPCISRSGSPRVQSRSS